MIVLDDFSKSYGHRFAVKNLSFTAETGCITALTGLNGAGKTTVLKAVCSIHYADTGSVRVNGIDAEQDSVQNKRQIGFMSEHADFSLPYTVYEFLHYEAAVMLADRSDSEKKKAVARAANRCVLHPVFLQHVKSLSNGWKRRLSLARSLLTDPPVLVLDEPASGLDPRQRSDMYALIKRLSETKTVLFSTHFLGEAENLCSKIVILHKGTVAAQGTKEQLCAQSKCKTLEQAFLRITE